MADYPPPVNQLLTKGEIAWERRGHQNYLRLGLTPEHIPDLIRMATDPALNRGDPDSPEVWAPVHAWRALGQLRAEAAVAPLLQLLQADEEGGDWAQEELPEVFAEIGPGILSALEAFLHDRSRGTYARGAVGRALEEMARRHPETRERCIGILTSQLERAEQSDAELNGFVIDNLMNLEAVEAAPGMGRAFAAKAVDESIAGDWEHVRYDLGLGPEPPPRRYVAPSFPLPGGGDQRSRTAKEKAKARRKQAAKSRKRNRKKRR